MAVLARDVLRELIASNVQTIDHFNWVSQLRYYWKYDEIGRLCMNAELKESEVETGATKSTTDNNNFTN